MNSASPSVCLLFPDQYRQAADVLGRAFVDDPLLKAILPPVAEADERARRMAVLFEAVLRLHRRDGQPVWGVMPEGKVAAAAVVEHTTHPASAASLALRGLSSLPVLAGALGWSGLRRALATVDILERNRPPEPHFYLNILGVEPAFQRRHFGVAILDYLHAQAALRPGFGGVYLETATEANVAYYSSHGYRVLNEIFPLGVRMWRMLQPRWN